MKMSCLDRSYSKKKLFQTPTKVGRGIADVKGIYNILNVQVPFVLLIKILYCPGDSRQLEDG